MGAALHIYKPPNKEMVDYVIVAGMTELRELWFPIIQDRHLHLLEACFTAGCFFLPVPLGLWANGASGLRPSKRSNALR